MKAICTLVGDNFYIDGDIIFNNPAKTGVTTCYYSSKMPNSLTITNTITCHKLPYSKVFSLKTRLYLCLLWFWYMTVLGRPYVYLTSRNSK